MVACHAPGSRLCRGTIYVCIGLRRGAGTVLSATTIKFKGRGWYVTDYGKGK
jgi:hypothetical protein